MYAVKTLRENTSMKNIQCPKLTPKEIYSLYSNNLIRETVAAASSDRALRREICPLTIHLGI